MLRTTALLVGSIIEVDEDVDLTPFIEAANELVTELCVPPGTLGVGRLEIIERWLSAHFYTVLDPRATNERAGSVGASYQSRVDLGLKTSHYGQHAMLLDTTGALAAYDKKITTGGARVAKVFWAGTPRPGDETYEEE